MRRAKLQNILGSVKLAKIGGTSSRGTTPSPVLRTPSPATGEREGVRGRGDLIEARFGKGRIIVGELASALAQAQVSREPMADQAGLYFIRRAFDGGGHYFIANRGENPVDQWMTLATSANSVVLMDPLTGRTGLGAVRPKGNGEVEVYLQLQPGESIILRTLARRVSKGDAWPYEKVVGQPAEIQGEWNVNFIQGGPDLPPEFNTSKLASWTELGGEEAQRFAGTAKYSIVFNAPSTSAKTWLLDLGNVCQSARLRLNGRDLGTLIAPPFRVAVDNLKPEGNWLEVEVTNVSANRIRDLDRRGVKWKNFHDINFVNQDYRPFDASNWPLYDSGLLGPVTLTAIGELEPGSKSAR
jgi:hypothetical protein